MAEEGQGVQRIERGEHIRRLDDLHEPGQRQRQEPHGHPRAKVSADPLAPASLQQEQSQQHNDRDRHHIRAETRRRDLKPFDCAENGDRRRDHAVAIKQRCADHPEQDQRAPAPEIRLAVRREAQQRHDAAFAVVLRAHDKQHILGGHDDRQRPEHKGQKAEHRFRVVCAGGLETFAEGVDRAGADVAVDNPKRREQQRAVHWLGGSAIKLPVRVRVRRAPSRFQRHAEP